MTKLINVNNDKQTQFWTTALARMNQKIAEYETKMANAENRKMKKYFRNKLEVAHRSRDIAESYLI